MRIRHVSGHRTPRVAHSRSTAEGRRPRCGRRRAVFETLEGRWMLSADSTVVFNEILYHPAGVDQGLEWIELCNQMAVDMELSGWSLTGAVEFEFADDAMIGGGGELLVIAADPAALQAATGFADALGPYTGRLSNGGERLVLRNNNDRLMDELTYDDRPPWPVAADGGGASLAKLDPLSASGPAENWIASPELGGTPGEVNFPTSFAPIGTETVMPLGVTWKYEASGTDLGSAWREPGFDDAGWSTGRAPASPVLISEAGYGDPDFVEIHNVTDATVDTSGWVVAVNNASDAQGSPDVNARHNLLWELPPSIEPGQVLYRSDVDDGTGHYWGENIFWRNASYGWIMVVDDQGGVADFVIWGYTAEEIASLAVDVGGFHVTVEDAWSGAAAVPLGALDESLQRVGNVDLDAAADWVPATSTMGEANPDLTLPFASPGLELPPGPTTYYLRTRFQHDHSVSQTELMLDTLVDDGAVFYLNGVEIYRQNMPPGEVTYDTLAGTEVVDPAYSGDVDVPVGGLVQGENVLAVEVHQAAADDTDMLFAAKLSATLWPPRWRRSNIELVFNEIAPAAAAPMWLELTNHGSQPIQLDRYVIASSTAAEHVLPGRLLAPGEFFSIDEAQLGFRPALGDRLYLYTPDRTLVLDGVRVDGRLQGRDETGAWLYPDAETPGAANRFELHDEIVINEIMYHHRAIFGEPFTEIDEQWIELYNRSAVPVGLGGWRLQDAVDFQFPDGVVIQPDRYLVVTDDAAALGVKYPGIDVVGDFSRDLSNKTDRIVLLDSAGNPADQLRYYDDAPWPRPADGRGSSLELGNPSADNSVPGAWAASDERAASPWRHYSYTMTAVSPVYGPAINGFHELRLGLLDDGAALIDNVTVVEDPAGSARQLIQNTSFTAGTDKWRLYGNHSHSEVIVDPDDPGDPANRVLQLVATGPTSYLDNRLETSLKYDGSLVPVVTGTEYRISFDAKWQSGSPQLHTELYYNKVVATTILEQPPLSGTPGRRNSTFDANPGPTYRDLAHTPAVPQPGEPVTVSVAAADPQGIDAMSLRYSVAGGGWQTAAMTAAAGGIYTGVIPGQAAGRVIQFYVRGVDALGAASTHPAAGLQSRAMVKVDDGRARPDKHNFRIIMTAGDAALLHQSLNILSNDRLGATVVYNESQVFYDAAIRLRGSMWSRRNPGGTGFNIKFPADRLFRGVHATVTIKRPAIREILVKHMNNHAGGIPGMYDDIVNLISHRSDNMGMARLSMARFNDIYLESQFPGDADGTMFKMEGIRVVQGTHNGDPEGLKLPFPIGWVYAYDITNLGDDKEQYRWSTLINSDRHRDDYSGYIAMAKAFSLSGTALEEAVIDVMDVDQWLRVFAMASLAGIGDMYTQGNPHNCNMYARPDDGKLITLPWDWDFTFNRGTTSALWGNKNLGKIIGRPVFTRLFYGHLLDLIQTTYNTAYMAPWLDHYGQVAGQSFSGYRSYIRDRGNYVRGRLPAAVPFRITTNGGNDFAVDDVMAVIEGDGWIDVRQIRLAGAAGPLEVTWLDADTWQIAVPLALGPNTLELQAYDRYGSLLGSDRIVVTSTYTGTRLRDALRITEINYNPAPPTPDEQAQGFMDKEDFEFIEMQNVSDDGIGGGPIDLLGVEFTEGIGFRFSSSPGQGAVLISEASTGNVDYVEIHNVSETPVDTTGWMVVVNNASDTAGPPDINAWHTTTWQLPDVIAPDEVLYRSDEAADADHYWGTDIFWRTNGVGWVMMVDDQGRLADFVVWGYSQAQIASLSIELGGFVLTASAAWNAEAVPARGTYQNSLQRRGTSDRDHASDWAFAQPQSKGLANAELVTPFLSEVWLHPGELIVVAANTRAFRARYGSGVSMVGPFDRNLSNGGEPIALRDLRNLEILQFAYDDDPDTWPGRADGKGASLELIDPRAVPPDDPERTAYLQDGANWRSSGEYGGSPGFVGAGLSGDVLVNEVLAHPRPPQLEAIELHNTTGETIELGGWYLSDSWGWDSDPGSGNYKKFRIPDGTAIPAGGYLVVDEDDFNSSGGADPQDFNLDRYTGGDLWLMQADAEDRLVRFVDHVEFGAAAEGESWGRLAENDTQYQTALYPMRRETLGSENSGPRIGPVLIGEVHYNPQPGLADDDLEFVEIYNTTAAAVDLTGWRIRGGIDFDFPAGATLQPRSALVVLPFELTDAAKLAAFRANYGIDDTVELIGGYTDRLGDTGERVTLQRPGQEDPSRPGVIARLLEDEVRYLSQDPWPATADGGNRSLHRVHPGTWGNSSTSWDALPPTPGVRFPWPEAYVVDRYVFYSGSAFDANGSSTGEGDDGAIAPDKAALLPGGSATFDNYTSYSAGINGLMIDVLGLPPGALLAADDFRFRIGNDDVPDGWTAAPTPSQITVRPGEGVDGSDRVTLVWEDNAIGKQWLEVTVLAGAATGLDADDVFYFGNAIGETGNSTVDAKVGAGDMLGARDNQRGFLDPAPIDFPFDFNRDARVNSVDMLIARDNQTHFLNALKLIGVPGGKAAGTEESGRWDASAADLSWLGELQRTGKYRRSSPSHSAAEKAVDELLKTWS